MTIQDLKKRIDLMKYLGFDEGKKMWVYSYQDKANNKAAYGIIAGKMNVVKLSSLKGLNLS
ncbi:hypothetical protein [Paenibacillus thermotolerans]|uniref:hypothetical protein n=1 Tax=Paenibacillus thermotolerans TaxID=3027807 RepID=UPI0023683FB7|nr:MULTISPECIES: hypothetical protein [unclassified Paenibacillus]